MSGSSFSWFLGSGLVPKCLSIFVILCTEKRNQFSKKKPRLHRVYVLSLNSFIDAVFAIFANLCLLPPDKTGLVDFPEKRAPTKHIL